MPPRNKKEENILIPNLTITHVMVMKDGENKKLIRFEVEKFYLLKNSIFRGIKLNGKFYEFDNVKEIIDIQTFNEKMKYNL